MSATSSRPQAAGPSAMKWPILGLAKVTVRSARRLAGSSTPVSQLRPLGQSTATTCGRLASPKAGRRRKSKSATGCRAWAALCALAGSACSKSSRGQRLLLPPLGHALTHGGQQVGQRAVDGPGDAGAQQRIDEDVGVQRQLLQLGAVGVVLGVDDGQPEPAHGLVVVVPFRVALPAVDASRAAAAATGAGSGRPPARRRRCCPARPAAASRRRCPRGACGAGSRPATARPASSIMAS